MKKTHDKNLNSIAGSSWTWGAERYTKSVVMEMGIVQGPEIFNRLLDDRIVVISGELDDWLCEYIKVNTLYLETLGDEDIRYYIHCPGGTVYGGMGVLDIMDFVRPDIVTVNTGLAASMGAVLLAYGTSGKRRSLKRSRTMIHQPLGYGGYQQAVDMEIDVKQINSLKRELYEIIAEKTGRTYDRVQSDCDRDYWMTAQDALDYGMIDEIVGK